MEGKRYDQFRTHPGSQPTGKGILYENYGSSFAPREAKVDLDGMVDLDASDDELDSLPRPSSSQPQPSLSQPSRPPDWKKRDTDDVIKFMKFKKTKQPDTDANGAAPTSKENTQRAAAKKATALGRDTSKNAVASSSTRPLGDNATTRNRSPKPIRAQSSAESLERRPSKSTGVAKQDRPRPRPVPKAKPPPLPPTSPRKPLGKLGATVSRPSFDGSSPASGKKRETQAPADFPDMSPLGKGLETERKRKNPAPGDHEGRKGKGKGKGKEKEWPQTTKRSYPEAGLSPLSSPTKSSPHWPSPLATPNKKTKLSSTTEYPAPSPLRPERNTKSKLQAFPMNTQTFEGSPPGSHGKRRSPGSDSDEERDRKRYKNQPVVLAESYDYEEDSELLFISPGTDPKTLCPYCDTPLPTQPTPLLKRLLEQTFSKSYRDVRPSNPLGRKAPMGVFVAVCQRHRFESETLPEAEERGWPKYIDWVGLTGRVQAMERDLEQILADPGDPIVYGDDDGEPIDTSQRTKGPRMRCIFWKDLVKELKAKGSKGVKGVQGQFANFEKTQPGYYGELGSVIIHQTLYDMFPLTAIDPDLVSPLTPNEFIQRILVPEVGMRLVIEDMELNPETKSDKKRAVAVLRESASYGVAMFPEDGGDWAGAASGKKHAGGEEVIGVADLMVMERARKRRKELEIEEKEEDEMWRLQQEKDKEEEEAQKQKAEIAKPKRRARRKAKETEKEVEPVATTAGRPRPRPIPKNKGKPVVTVESGSEMDTDSSLGPSHSTDDSDVDIVESRAEEVVQTPKPKLRKLDFAKLSDSDSDFPPEVAPSLQRSKRKAASTRATPASSEAESEKDTRRVDGSPRPRSPSTSLISSKRSTRGDSVLDLCSSSEDGGSKSRKAPLVESPPPPTRRKARKPTALPSSSEEDDEEATPRAKIPRKTGSHRTPSVASSNFRPLDAARSRREPVAKG
ncbi:RTC4-like domain-containing protein [Mycena polygramma]|nr:RTC4-like domain-containing protein [Mycena polygramma]